MSPEEKERQKEMHRGREKRSHAKMSQEKRQCEGKSRVTFSNTEAHHVIAMDPGVGVDRHFKDHQNCPEANTFLNHITTYRHHFTGDPSNPAEKKELLEQIRGQYITPMKQRELAERVLQALGRG